MMATHFADRIITKCQSWEDFTKALSGFEGPKAKKRRGDAFEGLTQLYLQTEPEYELKLKHIWLGAEVPRQVRDHINFPDQDEGIDLVAETFDGVFWSVQAKYRTDKSEALTRDDLDSFSTLSFVGLTTYISDASNVVNAMENLRLCAMSKSCWQRGNTYWGTRTDQWVSFLACSERRMDR